MSCDTTVLVSHPVESTTVVNSIPEQPIENTLVSVQGGRGMNAYEHAVAFGYFSGTEEEWFQSLSVANISTQAGNKLQYGEDNKLYVPAFEYETINW